MPQICPSPSRQLEAAAAAFRKARQKFPRNLGACACSGDAERNSLQVYPAIRVSTSRADRDPRGSGNRTYFPSISSSRTASWSQECRSGVTRGRRAETVCDGCRTRRDCVQKVPEPMISDLESRLKDTVSKSTHSSVGSKRRKHPRHRRPCIHAGGRTTEAEEQICLLHGFPAARRRSSIPPKPQNARYCDRKESSSMRGKAVCRPEDELERICCSDSPTLADFPTKLQTWEDRTYRGSCPREKKRISIPRQDSGMQQNPPNDQILKLLARNREALCNSCLLQAENSTQSGTKKGQEPSSDICLRPSLIKAAQRRAEGRRSHQNYNLYGHASKHSAWDDNLNVIKHKDSLSILMDRFRGNDERRSLKLQNIYELNSVLGSKTSCGKGGAVGLDKIHRESLESIETGVNPVAKLGKVAKQARRENENRLKNLRNRTNRSGVCCSPKGTPWRRTF